MRVVWVVKMGGEGWVYIETVMWVVKIRRGRWGDEVLLRSPDPQMTYPPTCGEGVPAGQIGNK